MKKLTLLFVLGVFAISSTFASENPKEKLRNEIANLLRTPAIELDNNDLFASVEFIINNKNEIVVINVDSEKEEVANYVKSRLNYQKVKNTVPEQLNNIFKTSVKVVQP